MAQALQQTAWGQSWLSQLCMSLSLSVPPFLYIKTEIMTLPLSWGGYKIKCINLQ